MAAIVVMEFTPGEDKLVILDVNGSLTTLAGLFDSLLNAPHGALFLSRERDKDRSGDLSSAELDAGARVVLAIDFDVSGTSDGGGFGGYGGRLVVISFDRVTSEALNDMAVWDTLTGGS